MSQGQILALGAIAGLTIFLGLPVARLRHLSARTRALLNAIATGVLLFLFWDILAQAVEPVEGALTAAAVDGTGSWGRFAALAAVGACGLTVGLGGLVLYERRMIGRAKRISMIGPGAASVAEFERPARALASSPARMLALLIATGIGLHNFAEGLAIGQAAASDEIALALLLVIGFGLHNATEGFGIVAPLASEEKRPSWGFLALLGLIGGGPTFVGTLIGQAFVSEMLSVVFLGLAAGSILYVVMELLNAGRKLGSKEILVTGLLIGLFAGFATDFVLVAAGA